VEKTRRRVRSEHSESDKPNAHFTPVMEEVSLYTSPSLHSVSSVFHDHKGTDGAKQKVNIVVCTFSAFTCARECSHDLS